VQEDDQAFWHRWLSRRREVYCSRHPFQGCDPHKHRRNFQLTFFFLCHTALQFCRDPLIRTDPPEWLYGGKYPSDEAAMKAAGREFLGLASIFHPGLLSYVRSPLMTLVKCKQLFSFISMMHTCGSSVLCRLTSRDFVCWLLPSFL